LRWLTSDKVLNTLDHSTAEYFAIICSLAHLYGSDGWCVGEWLSTQCREGGCAAEAQTLSPRPDGSVTPAHNSGCDENALTVLQLSSRDNKHPTTGQLAPVQ
jgi:hypothetical protein